MESQGIKSQRKHTKALFFKCLASALFSVPGPQPRRFVIAALLFFLYLPFFTVALGSARNK